MEHNNSANSSKSELNFEEAWDIIQEEGVNKIIHSFETEASLHRQLFTSEQYMRLYTIVYNICSPNPIGPSAQRLYRNYKKTFQDYISAKALPSLQGKANVDLLQELVKQWNNHKVLTYWLSRFFGYLERYFIKRIELPTLKGTSHLIFRELVYREFNDQIRGVVLFLISKEREGAEIDQAMVKNVLDIYIEMGEGSAKFYEKDFEEAMLDDTISFYSSKASDWVSTMSHTEYMLKLEECLNQERDRMTAYLSHTNKYQLWEVVKKEFFIVRPSRPIEETAS